MPKIVLLNKISRHIRHFASSMLANVNNHHRDVVSGSFDEFVETSVEYSRIDFQ